MVYWSKSMRMWVGRGSVISGNVGGTRWEFSGDIWGAMQTDGYFKRKVLDAWRRTVGDPADLVVLVIK